MNEFVLYAMYASPLTRHTHQRFTAIDYKFKYVINNRPTWVQNSCPGSLTGVAWYGWARKWGVKGTMVDSGGTLLFMVSISNEMGLKLNPATNKNDVTYL